MAVRPDRSDFVDIEYTETGDSDLSDEALDRADTRTSQCNLCYLCSGSQQLERE